LDGTLLDSSVDASVGDDAVRTADGNNVEAREVDDGRDGGGDDGETNDGRETEIGDHGNTGPRLYVAVAQSIGTEYFPNEIVRIDVSEGRAVADATMNGVTSITERNGSLLVARDYGYSRICVLDRDTLAILRTVLLPWDPDHAAFSADGRYMYAGHGEGYVGQVRLADGQVTGDVKLAMPQDLPSAGTIVGLALNPAESRLVVTTTEGIVAEIEVAGNLLTVVRQWSPPMFSDRDCLRQPRTPIFDRMATRFATFDPNCGAFDIYDAGSGSLDAAASVRFPWPMGTSIFSTIVLDALGQVWTGNAGTVYRTGMMDSNRQRTFSVEPLGGPQLAINASGDTVYVIPDDPRANGIFTIDATSGAQAPLVWNLDMIPFGGVPVAAAFVSQ
jgi:DNA-binding beta-propeller fold protein YncE